MTAVTKNMFAVCIDRFIGVLVFCLTEATARKMGVTIIVFTIVRIGASSVSVAKDRRAVGVRYQRLARRADRNATAITAGGIAAYILVVYKQSACVRRCFQTALNEDAAATPVKARHAVVISDVD